MSQFKCSCSSFSNRIVRCNAKGKGSKKKCITTTGLWDRHIPTEILEGILSRGSRLGLKDNIQASAVCKTWCESAVSWRPGEATWTTHCFESSLLRSWDKCVFSNGVFYFLSTRGCLGVFDPCEATWNLLPVKPLLFPEEVDSPVFFMEHEGDIFVMCSRLDSNHMVFKLNMKQNVWEEKRDLGGLTVFASVPGSFIRACLSAEDMNRIYPSFVH